MLSKIEKYIAWLLPPVLGGSFYLMMYISSHFEEEVFLWEVILFFTLDIALLAFLVRRYLDYRQKKLNKQALGINSFVIAMVIVIVVQMIIYVGLKQLLIVYTQQDDYISIRHLALSFAQAFLFGLIIVGIQFLVQYIKAWNLAQIQKERLEKENAKARLGALKAQLNPHFLFNNFNTLNGLIHENPEEASEFLVELSELYRSVLKLSNHEIILLKEEMNIINHFNFLMKKRFGDNYQCQVDLTDKLLQDYYVPPLAIQMLLENVIKHNRIDDLHHLVCSIKKEGEYLVIENEISLKTQQQASSGLGLENLKSRYEMLSDLPMKIEKTNQFFKVSIPLIQVDQF